MTTPSEHLATPWTDDEFRPGAGVRIYSATGALMATSQRESAARLIVMSVNGGARFRSLLNRLRQWDHLDASADGPYWRDQIEAVLADIPRGIGER